MTRIVCSLIVFIVLISTAFGQAIRTIDGTFNNVFNPEWGAQDDRLARVTTNGFADGISLPGGADRPNPREISNVLFAQDGITNDVKSLSDFVWVFGQFIDHDITFVLDDHTEPLLISIPSDDKVFIPGGPPIPMFRSIAARGTGTTTANPREYVNDITSFVDASGVYGSDDRRAAWLRTFEDGKLKTSEGNNLPWNTVTGYFNDPIDPNSPHMDNATGVSSKIYVAGDARANENPLLISFHTLFVREHNRLCDEILAEDPSLSDEEVYQKARKWNGAFLQSILYNEWLPAMGIKMPEYKGYRSDINPRIFNVFSAAAFRVGHTLINSNLIRLDNDGEELAAGSISLKDSYFNPTVINLAGGIEPYLKGMATQVQQKMDNKVIDDVRNFLFGNPSAGGLDLAAININRGRERGLPDYNTVRADFGLPRIKAFDEITKHPEDAALLQKLYGGVDNVDPWVGMLSEDYMPDAIIGRTLMQIIERQFQVLRDGDRFYYEGDRGFSAEDIAEIKNTTMHDIIMRNTGIDIMQANVFEAMPVDLLERGPEIAEVSLLSAEVFPNPSAGPFEVKIYAEQAFDAQIDVYDLNGAKVHSQVAQLEEGNNFIPMNLSNYAHGAYYNVVIQRDQLTYKVLRVFHN